MSSSNRVRITLIASVAVFALSGDSAYMQADIVDPAKSTLPNPDPTVIKNWGALPEGRILGQYGRCRHRARREHLGLRSVRLEQL